jgi:HEAT repeat protein
MHRYPAIVAMWIALLRSLFSRETQTQMWIADLADDNLEAAAEAAQALGEHGDPSAVPALLAALAMATDEEPDDDPYIAAAQVDFRQDVVRASGNLGDHRAVSALEAVAAHDPDRGVREEATTALQRIGA